MNVGQSVILLVVLLGVVSVASYYGDSDDYEDYPEPPKPDLLDLLDLDNLQLEDLSKENLKALLEKGTTLKDSTVAKEKSVLEEEEDDILFDEDEELSWDGWSQTAYHNTPTLELELLGPLQHSRFRSSDEVMEEQVPMSNQEFEDTLSKLSYLLEVPSEDEELLELEAASPQWATKLSTQDISASLQSIREKIKSSRLTKEAQQTGSRLTKQAKETGMYAKNIAWNTTGEYTSSSSNVTFSSTLRNYTNNISVFEEASELIQFVNTSIISVYNLTTSTYNKAINTTDTQVNSLLRKVTPERRDGGKIKTVRITTIISFWWLVIFTVAALISFISPPSRTSKLEEIDELMYDLVDIYELTWPMRWYLKQFLKYRDPGDEGNEDLLFYFHHELKEVTELYQRRMKDVEAEEDQMSLSDAQ